MPNSPSPKKPHGKHQHRTRYTQPCYSWFKPLRTLESAPTEANRLHLQSHRDNISRALKLNQPPHFQTLLRLQGQRQLRIPRPSAKPPGNPASRILCWVPGPPWTVPWPRKSREGSHSTSQSHVPHGGEVVSPQRDQDTASSSPRLSRCHSCGHP